MSRRELAAAWMAGLCLALTGTAWSDVSGTLTRLPTPPGLTAGDRFGATVAMRDGWIAVGAYEAQNGAGAVYLFQQVGSGWTLLPEPIRGGPGEQLGFALAFTPAGELLAGAPFARVGGVRCGAVYRVSTNGTKDRLNLPCEEGAEMGAAVATAGSWTVAGARGAAQRAGRVYADTGRGFAPLPASPSAGDELGLSVATDGKVVVAGAPFTSRNGLADAGTVLVFSPSSADAGWTVETLLPAAPAARDAFGYSVAVASPALAAGAPLAHGEGGAVHVFGGDRRDREVGGASGPAQLGVALAFAGSQLFAGARRDNGGGSGKSGAVYLVPNDSQRVGPALRANPPVNGAELGFDLAGGPGALVIGAFGEGGTGAAYVTGEASTATAVVQLLKSADAVAEEDGGIDITVTVSPADHPDLTVLLATADGTARAGSDYEETLRTVTIPPGLDRQTVHIPVFADSSCEGDETFTVSLSSPAPPQAGVVLGPQTQETVTIHDTPVLVLTPSPLAFAEQGDPVQLSVQLSCPPAGRVTVGLKAEGGSGTILPPLLTFSAGSTAPQQALVTSLGTCDTNPSYKIVARVKSSRDPRYLNRQGETLAECVSSTLTPFHQDDGTLLFTDVLCNHGPVSAPYSTEIAPLGANVVWAGADNGVALVGFGADRVLWRGIVPPCRGNQGTMAIRIVSARTPS